MPKVIQWAGGKAGCWPRAFALPPLTTSSPSPRLPASQFWDLLQLSWSHQGQRELRARGCQTGFPISAWWAAACVWSGLQTERLCFCPFHPVNLYPESSLEKRLTHQNTKSRQLQLTDWPLASQLRPTTRGVYARQWALGTCLVFSAQRDSRVYRTPTFMGHLPLWRSRSPSAEPGGICMNM